MTANTVLAKGTTIEVESASAGVYNTVGEVIGFSGPGGSAKVIDVTNMASTRKEKRMGLPDEGQFSIDLNFYPDDTGQTRLKALRDSQDEGSFKVTYADGTIDTFDGFVLEVTTSGTLDDVLKAKITIEITGTVTRT